MINSRQSRTRLKYYLLYRYRRLEILEGCSVGTRACQILCTYWGWMRMVAKAGGYYRSEFKGSRVMMQGDPLSPTILNVVVNAVV